MQINMKPVTLKDYADSYCITIEGFAWSKPKYNDRGCVHNGMWLKPQLTPSGYQRICLRNSKKVKYYFIHRLVAEAFIPNPNSKPCVNHKNGIKTDNRTENLEWVTHSENEKHAYSIGLKEKARELSRERARLLGFRNRKRAD